MKRSFLQIQTTSDWAQIWCGGWNCELIEVYQISAKSETNNFWRFGLVCFGHKSGLSHPPFKKSNIKYMSVTKSYDKKVNVRMWQLNGQLQDGEGPFNTN